MRTPARWLVAAVILLSSACGSPGAAARTDATATPLPTVADAPASDPGTPAAALPPGPTGASPDAASALQTIEHLAVTIGSRPAGSPQERMAADYLAGLLRDAGYDTSVEAFQFDVPYDESFIRLAGDVRVDAFVLEGAPSDGGVNARLVFAGAGSPQEVDAAGVSGQIALIDRGMIPFAEKVRAAEDAGAVGVIVVNNEPGPYRGTLGTFSTEIPVVGAALEDRDALMAAADLGSPVQVVALAGTRRARSQNVIGRDGDQCAYYLGAHYDSVPEGPGANDNASGVGVVMELARAYRTDGLCVIAFGAEEVGLWGSRAYVSSHLAGGAFFMLNVDMAGKLTDPIIVGDRSLTRSILDILDTQDVGASLHAGEFPPFASSDHVSFTAVGVPAVTLNAGDDQFIHTPQDDMANVDQRSLDVMLRASGAALVGLIDAARAGR